MYFVPVSTVQSLKQKQAMDKAKTLDDALSICKEGIVDFFYSGGQVTVPLTHICLASSEKHVFVKCKAVN